MTTLNINEDAQFALKGLLNRFTGMAHEAGDMLMKAAESRSRADQVARLKEKTDAELKELGIHNESELYRYVFRDLIAF